MHTYFCVLSIVLSENKLLSGCVRKYWNNLTQKSSYILYF